MNKLLSNYFGENYQTDPSALKGLNNTQKSNLKLIIDKAKELGIKNNFAIAALLSIVSKESNFKTVTEGTYKNTKVERIREVFGKNRTSPFNDASLEKIKNNDVEFFDLVYGPTAKKNGAEVYGNDNPGDGYKYRGRGFNQLTFKNLYRNRGKSVGLDLVNSPDLIDDPKNAALVLVDYYLATFKSLPDEIQSDYGITKRENSLATINSFPNLETAVDLFYLATAGFGKYKNTVAKYKQNSTRNSDGSFNFPNDKLGGYSKARNRAPYFLIILGGGKLPDLPTVSNSPSATPLNPELNSGETFSEGVIGQDDSEENNSSESQNAFLFNPTQLTQILEPNISVTEIVVTGDASEKRTRKQFLTGIGTAPYVYYNGFHIEYTDISIFELYHEGMLPAMKIIFVDRNGIFKDDGFPLDDSLITIFIYSRSKRLRSIKMDFKITKFKDLGGQFLISGIVDIPLLYVRRFQSYANKSSFDTLKQLASDCGMGFCSNMSNTNDLMTWINPGKPKHEFILDVVNNSYISDESFTFCYIDYYYNLCYVDLEKELLRDNSEDLQISSDGKTEFSENEENDEVVSRLFLTTDKSLKDSNQFISSYDVTNKSTKISLDWAYLTKNKSYETSSKELLVFSVDSITNDAEKLILKGKPGEEEFYKENQNSVWVGKLDLWEDGNGNSHKNFNYSPTQNSINLRELSKINLEINLPNPNFNIYVTQKLFVALLKDLPGVNQSGGLSYKRLDGDWIISEIRYMFDGKKHTQKVTLLKRNLELLENEKLNELPRQTKNSVDNSEGNYENELSPFDSPPNDPTSTNEQITPSSEPVLVTDSNLERVVNQSSDLKDNSGVLRNLVVIDNKSVDERVAQAFISMRDAALKDGVKLVINSAFRPAFGKKFNGTTSEGKSIEITTQESLRRAHAPSGKKNDEDFIFKGKSKQFSPETAAPGKSNHGNGIALDLNTGIRSKKTLNEKVYIWLIKNSWRFGFVRTVASEEWHFELRPDISSKGPYAVLKSTDGNLFYSDLGLNNLNF